MKKSITGVVALLAGAFVAHSQGTVSLANAYALSSYIYVSLGSTKLGGTSTLTTGTPASDVGNGSDWTVALWGGPLGSSSAQMEANGNLATATLETGNAPAGTWLTGVSGAIPGVPDVGTLNATVQLAAWYNNGGTVNTYAAALLAGDPVGLSAVQNASTGGPSTSGPPTTAPNLPSGLGNIVLSSGTTVTPEPSTIALGVMGASAFLLRLRKKQ